MSRVLALDIGTSSLKASIIEDNGTIDVQQQLPTRFVSPGCVDPEIVWNDVAALIASTIANQPHAPDAIIASGQGDGFWATGKDGKARLSYTWNSTFASNVVDQWDREHTVDELYQRTGTVIWPGTSAAIWRWLDNEHPTQLEDIDTVFTAKDWINYKLTGVVTTDITDASIPFTNPYTRQLDFSLFAVLQCSELADKIPQPELPGTLIGKLSHDAARETHLATGTPVYLGSLDCVASTRGAGISDIHDAVASLGTTSAIFSLVRDPVPQQKPVGATILWPQSDLFLRVLGSSSGAQVLEWFLREYGYLGSQRYTQFWNDVRRSNTHGELFLPFLNGERVPFLAPAATGNFLGITAQTTRAELARAVVEGIVFSLRHCLESAGDTQQVILTGGGASSADFCQLIATVFQHTVYVDTNPQLGTLGVASFVPGFASLSERHAHRQAFSPREGDGAVQERYQHYQASIQALLPLWKERK